MSTPSIIVPARPLELRPNRVWRSYRGGRLLSELEGRADAVDDHFPEDWIGSAVRAINPAEVSRPGEGLASVALGDELVGLDELFAEQVEFFFGAEHRKHYGAQPEFLVKFIDSAERLHFQCHPTKAFSRENLDSRYGKFEAYYVLDVRPEVGEGKVYVGFQRPPARDQLKDIIERQNIPALLDCFEPITVKRGDVVIVPGGVPHALGAGVLLVEILEPSDWVARFEYQRGDYVLPEKDRFMGRGVDFALDMMDLQAKSVDFVREHYFCPATVIYQTGNARREQLIGPSHTNCFQVWKTSWRGQAQRTVNAYCIAIVTQGSCRLAGPDGFTRELGLFDRVIIPHGMKSLRLDAPDGCELLECYPPNANPSAEILTA